jgi:hypothetical protein
VRDDRSERILLGLGVRVDPASLSAPVVPTGATLVRAGVWAVAIAAAIALLVPRGFSRLPIRLGAGMSLAIVGAAAGLVVRVGAWSVVLVGLSPERAIDVYVSHRAPGEPLAALGVDPRTIGRAARTDVAELEDANAAARWLEDVTMPAVGQPPRRRFVAVATRELPRLNAFYRERHQENVPVLAGAKDAVVLVASALVPGERSENPLDAFVRGAVPAGLRRVGAVLGHGAIDVVGWELVESSGRRGRLRIHLRSNVAAPLAGHCTFVHVDHTPTRFSAEHLESVYPTSLWREGDVIVDEFAFTLPAHFGRGSYPLYWGAGVLPCSDDRRMPIESGPHDAHHRVSLGRLEVR